MQKSATFAILIIFVMIVSTGLTGCYSQKILSSSTQSPIHVDGFADDWDSYPRISFPEFRTSYSIANNDSILYILILRRDLDQWVAQGVNIWIAPNGKTSKAINIRYYGSPRPSIKVDKSTTLTVDEYEENYDLDNNAMRRELGGIWDMILVQSAGGEDSQALFSNGTDGPRAAFRILPGNVRAYEFAFPLKNHQNSNFKLPIDTGGRFDIGFEFISRHAMVWGDTMWEWKGSHLVKTYYWTNAPRKMEVFVQHEPIWNRVQLK